MDDMIIDPREIVGLIDDLELKNRSMLGIVSRF